MELRWSRLLMLPALLAREALAQCSQATALILKATPTTEAASVPTCQEFTGGDIRIYNTSEVDLAGWETINGNLQSSQAEANLNLELHLHSESLRRINGSLLISHAQDTSSRPAGSVRVSFPRLEYIRKLDVGGPLASVSLSFGENTTAETVRMTQVQAQSGGTTLYLNVSRVLGGITTAESEGDEGEILLNRHKTFWSSVEVFNDTLTIRDNEFVAVLLPRLERLLDTQVYRNEKLEKVEMGMVSARSVFVNDNGRETSAAFDRLEKLSSWALAKDPGSFSQLVSLSLPRLKVIDGGSFSVTNNLFPELNLDRLETGNATLVIRNNTVLSDLRINRVSELGGLTIKFNPRLVNLTANILQKVDEVDMEGNFTNVEFFSLQEVTGDFKLVGDPSMDCSWFDENLFQKVVKGGYLCEGNHTKPEVARKPSTPTDVASLDALLGGDGSDDSPGSPDGPNGGKAGGGLSTGAKAGIGVGVSLGVLLLLGAGAWLFLGKRKAAAKDAPAAEETDESYRGKGELDGTEVAKQAATATVSGAAEADGAAVVLAAEKGDDKALEVGAQSERRELELDSAAASAQRHMLGDTGMIAELPAHRMADVSELPGHDQR